MSWQMLLALMAVGALGVLLLASLLVAWLINWVMDRLFPIHGMSDVEVEEALRPVCSELFVWSANNGHREGEL